MPETPGLVGGADLVPHHVGDDRRAVIGDHHDVHAVGQLELGGADARLGSVGLGIHSSMRSAKMVKSLSRVHVTRRMSSVLEP